MTPIKQIRTAVCNMDDYARMGEINPIGARMVLSEAIDELEKLRAEKEALLLKIGELLSRPDANAVARERDILRSALVHAKQHLILGGADFHKRKAMRIIDAAIASVKDKP